MVSMKQSFFFLLSKLWRFVPFLNESVLARSNRLRARCEFFCDDSFCAGSQLAASSNVRRLNLSERAFVKSEGFKNVNRLVFVKGSKTF